MKVGIVQKKSSKWYKLEILLPRNLFPESLHLNVSTERGKEFAFVRRVTNGNASRFGRPIGRFARILTNFSITWSFTGSHTPLLCMNFALGANGNWTMHHRTHIRRNTTDCSGIHIRTHTYVTHRLPFETMRGSRASICIYLLICTTPFTQLAHVDHGRKCVHDNRYVIPVYVCRNVYNSLPSFSGFVSSWNERSVTAKVRFFAPTCVLFIAASFSFSFFCGIWSDNVALDAWTVWAIDANT